MDETTTHEQTRPCGACGEPVAFKIIVPAGAKLDPKALTVRDVRCANELSDAKKAALEEQARASVAERWGLEEGAEMAPELEREVAEVLAELAARREVGNVAGRCQVCGDRIAMLASFPAGCTFTVDSMRMLHETCAIPGARKAS